MLKLVKDMERKPCHDCSCQPGEHHLSGCDTERCPKCKGQLLSCGCFMTGDEFNEEEFAKYPQEKYSGIMFEAEMLYCEEHNLYCYFSKTNGWVKCDEDHEESTHDINSAVVQMRT